MAKLFNLVTLVDGDNTFAFSTLQVEHKSLIMLLLLASKPIEHDFNDTASLIASIRTFSNRLFSK